MTRTLTLEISQEMGDCIDWLVGSQKSTEEHVLMALLANGIHVAERGTADEGFELMCDALELWMKRWARAEAPEIWSNRKRTL